MLIAAAVTLPFLRKLKQTRATQIFTFAPALVGNRIYVGGARLNYAVQARCHIFSCSSTLVIKCPAGDKVWALSLWRPDGSKVCTFDLASHRVPGSAGATACILLFHIPKIPLHQPFF